MSSSVESQTNSLFRSVLSPARHCYLIPLVEPSGSTSVRRSHGIGREDAFEVAKEIRGRVLELQKSGIDPYPRVHTSNDGRRSPGSKAEIPAKLADFFRLAEALEKGITNDRVQPDVRHGRVVSVRTAGSSLYFLDLILQKYHLQVLVDASALDPTVTLDAFKARRKLLQRGDVVSVTGLPHRTNSGQIAMKATKMPQILSPCLHPATGRKAPSSRANDDGALCAHQYAEMQANSRDLVQLMSERDHVLRTLREWFQDRGFLEVQTPILAGSAGGAVARSFRTTATEFSDRELALRVAPELWLKRLVLAGMEKIFEIGASFRNEGIDKMHNPEFLSCEFYCAYRSIDQLLEDTENMLSKIVLSRNERASQIRENRPHQIQIPPLALDHHVLRGPYPRIDFLTGLSQALGQKLPNLESESAVSELVQIFEERSIRIPTGFNLPRLLDKLCSHYLEPQCIKPTWITNQPECLSPLSKTVVSDLSGIPQRVAARAELFINGYEVINCYEEENSPFEQRYKFLMHQRFAGETGPKPSDHDTMELDEDYLEALEWGLPPVAGWGCGIDRLIMALMGKPRIQNVMPFGSLRTVTRPSQARDMIKLPARPFAELPGSSVETFRDSTEADAGGKGS